MGSTCSCNEKTEENEVKVDLKVTIQPVPHYLNQKSHKDSKTQNGLQEANGSKLVNKVRAKFL